MRLLKIRLLILFEYQTMRLKKIRHFDINLNIKLCRFKITPDILISFWILWGFLPVFWGLVLGFRHFGTRRHIFLFLSFGVDISVLFAPDIGGGPHVTLYGVTIAAPAVKQGVNIMVFQRFTVQCSYWYFFFKGRIFVKNTVRNTGILEIYLYRMYLTPSLKQEIR